MSSSSAQPSLLIAVLALPFLLWPGTGPAAPSGTQVILIGTVHSPTENFTAETLVQILDRVKPDLILFEVDASFVDESFRLKEPYQKMSLEAVAVTAFQARIKVPLRPYDIEGRNRFYQETNYFQRQRDLSRMLGKLYQADQLTMEAKALLEGITTFDAVRDAFQKDRPEVINSQACDAAMEQKQRYARKGMRRIVALTPALRPFDSFVKLRDEEWERRNQAMVENILKYAREDTGKRIVVLCGFEHRYFLTQLLKRQVGIRLREYWSY